MTRSGTILTLSFLLILSACREDNVLEVGALDNELEDLLILASEGKGLTYFELPESNDFGNIPQDPNNPVTEEKVRLGKHLFHETGLGVKPKKDEGLQTYSCASCHHSRAGFQAGVRQGIGEGGTGFGRSGEHRLPNSHYLSSDLDIQPIRTPSAMNGAWQPNQLWNGQFGATHLNQGTEAQWTEETPKHVNHLGYEGLETQAIAGLSVHRMNVDQDFCEPTKYKEYFETAFPDKSGADLYNLETAGLAIAAYERTVMSNMSPFQRWLKGDRNAMFEDEKRGAILFFGKARCFECHTGPALNQMEFYALGMGDLEGAGVFSEADEMANLGRGGFTQKEEDNYKFKVPQLYNLKDSPFYGHGGDFQSIRDVIIYKNEAIASNSSVPASQLAAEFVPLALTDEEIDHLTRFVESGLYDARLDRYDPTNLPSGFCFPVNDIASKSDLGCN